MLVVLTEVDSQDNHKRCHLNSYLFTSYTVGRIKHNVVFWGPRANSNKPKSYMASTKSTYVSE